ncbi:MAG: hypothetical protein U1F43_05380 [Myxococcota bacterium]
MRLAPLTIGLALALQAACGDSGGHARSDAADTADVSAAPDGDDVETPVPAVFVAGPEATREALRVELASIDEHELVVDVVVRGVHEDDQTFAVGYRLSFDPDVLAFVDATAGAAWSEHGLSMGREGRPGVYVGAVAHPHAFFEDPPAPAGEVVVQRLRFTRKTLGPTPLALVAARSRLSLFFGASSAPDRTFAPEYIGAALAAP